MRRWIGAIVGALIAAAAVACTPSAKDTSEIQLDGTLFDVVFGPAGDQAVSDLLELRTAQCMSAMGWVYVPETGTQVAAYLRLGLSEAEFAREYGFALTRPPEIGPTEASKSNYAYAQELDDAARFRYADALESCGKGAAGEVDPVAAAVAATASSYIEEVLTPLLASDAGQSALTAWRACLQSDLAKGVSDMSGLVAAARGYLDSAALDPSDALRFETDLASRAVACNEARRHDERDALAGLEADFIDHHREQVADLLALIKATTTGQVA